MAAANLGALVDMVGKLGQDSYGSETINNFKQHGVNTQHLMIDDDPSIPSGIASIMVDDQGNNAIVIVGGTNNRITKVNFVGSYVLSILGRNPSV